MESLADPWALRKIAVERGILPTSLEIDESLVESPDDYPVTVNLRHLSEEEATPKQTATRAGRGETSPTIEQSRPGGGEHCVTRE